MSVIERTLNISEPTDEWREKEVNGSWVLGCAFRALSKCPAHEWVAKGDAMEVDGDGARSLDGGIDWKQWVQLGVERWSWSSLVVGGLVAIAKCVFLPSSACHLQASSQLMHLPLDTPHLMLRFRSRMLILLSPSSSSHIPTKRGSGHYGFCLRVWSPGTPRRTRS